MLEAKTIPIVKRIVTQVKSIRRKKVEDGKEHPDLRMIRCNQAAKDAMRDHEHVKTTNRSYFIRS